MQAKKTQIELSIVIAVFSLKFFRLLAAHFVIVNRESSHHFHVSIYENNVIEYKAERDSDYVLNSMRLHVFVVCSLHRIFVSFEIEQEDKLRHTHNKKMDCIAKKKRPEEFKVLFERLMVVTKAKNFP